MAGDELLIGTITAGIATYALAAAVGPWERPYELRIARALNERYGRRVARVFYLSLALCLYAAAVAILAGLRPGYAYPDPVHPALAIGVSDLR